MLVLPSFFPDVIHQFQEVPLQSIIDETVVLLNKENDGYRAEKFVSLIRMSHNLLGYSETLRSELSKLYRMIG